MNDFDDDIEFEFFEDPKPPQRRRLGRRPPAPPPPPPPGPPGDPPRRPPKGPIGPAPGVAPTVRLVALAAFAIAIAVIFAFVVRSCQSSSTQDAYKSYFEDTGQVGSGSAKIGHQLVDVLASDLNQSELETKLSGLVTSQEKLLGDANALTPPGPVRDAHHALVESLMLRRDGLAGLLAVFRDTATKKDADEAGAQLAEQARKLVASDVVWDSLFRARGQSLLQAENITGVSPPRSIFVTDAAFASEESLKQTWERLHGRAGSSGGLHGTDITSVTVLPTGRALSEDKEETITVTSNLGFQVDVHNGGAFQESNIEVAVRLENPGSSPIKVVKTIKLINRNETAHVKFNDFFEGGLPQVAQRVTLLVTVAPVPGEQFKDNNKATYTLLFRLS